MSTAGWQVADPCLRLFWRESMRHCYVLHCPSQPANGVDFPMRLIDLFIQTYRFHYTVSYCIYLLSLLRLITNMYILSRALPKTIVGKWDILINLLTVPKIYSPNHYDVVSYYIYTLSPFTLMTATMWLVHYPRLLLDAICDNDALIIFHPFSNQLLATNCFINEKTVNTKHFQ